MNAPMEFIYVLTVVCAGLAVLFLTGKGSRFLTVYKAAEKDREAKERQNKRLSKVIGVCFALMDILLIVTAVSQNRLPEWFTVVFAAVTGICMFIIFFAVNADIIIKDR